MIEKLGHLTGKLKDMREKFFTIANGERLHDVNNWWLDLIAKHVRDFLRSQEVFFLFFAFSLFPSQQVLLIDFCIEFLLRFYLKSFIIHLLSFPGFC